MPKLKRRDREEGDAKRVKISAKKAAVFMVLGVFVLILALLAYLFFTRNPVILVSDSSFAVLYGRQRARVMRAVLFLRLFRPVKTVSVAANAGSDMVSLAVWDASKQPFAVFFPYRYYEGALRYAQDHPGVQAAVFAGRQNMPPGYGSGQADSPPAVAWFSTDSRTDFYRAGYCAGALAVPEDRIKQAFEMEQRTILVFQDNVHGQDREQEAFLLGLEAYRKDISDLVTGVTGGANAPFPGIPHFAGADWEFFGRDNPDDVAGLACAVISGKGDAFFQANLAIPLVIFTWLDPAFLPDETVLVFDDSPWALIPQALDMLKTGRGSGAIPSAVRGGTLVRLPDLAGNAERFFFPFSGGRYRILPKDVVARIKKLNFLENTADN
jgi:hypothetical protein